MNILEQARLLVVLRRELNQLIDSDLVEIMDTYNAYWYSGDVKPVEPDADPRLRAIHQRLSRVMDVNGSRGLDHLVKWMQELKVTEG